MKTPISLADFEKAIMNRSPLFNINDTAPFIKIADGWAWDASKYLTISYPTEFIADDTDAPILDNGIQIPSGYYDEWITDRLNISAEYIDTTFYTGRFVETADDRPNRFHVEANTKATDVMLFLKCSWFDGGLMPTADDVKRFCFSHDAKFSLKDPNGLWQIIVLPIGGEFLRPALYHIWSAQINEAYYDVLRYKKHFTAMDACRPYTERLHALKEKTGLEYNYHDTQTCCIEMPTEDDPDSAKVYHLDTADGLHRFIAAVTILENSLQPASAFYAQT